MAWLRLHRCACPAMCGYHGDCTSQDTKNASVI